jgi:hypothetical protein
MLKRLFRNSTKNIKRGFIMGVGRPMKNGIDYFPLDVDIDDKIKLVEAEHGIIGFGVLIKIFQKIYKDNYWIKFDRKALYVFANSINVDRNRIYDIINSCLEWEVFDQKLYTDFEVLTSKGIQKRFFEIIKRRKHVEICKKLLLIKPKFHDNINLIYVDIKKQRKVKERKVKEKNSIIYPSNFLKFWQAYPKKTGKPTALKAYQNIKEPKPTLNQILQAISDHQKTEQWENKQFIPNPATWLNQRRWEDEIEKEESLAEYRKRMGYDDSDIT